MREDEFFPHDKVIATILAEQIFPFAEKVGSQCPSGFTYGVFCHALDKRRFIGTWHSSGEPVQSGTSNGEVRIRVRRTFREGTYRFFVECQLRGVKDETGFSGFSLSGKVVDKPPDPPATKRDSSTMKYNDWNWADWV